MVIGIFGESCVGKSTLAKKISQNINARIYTGKDYRRMAKNEDAAKEIFIKQLREAVNSDSIIYVISEKEHLKFLPEGAVRILVTANLDLIKTRFAARMNGKLSVPVEKMLENKHGCFDEEEHDIHIDNLNGSNDNSIIEQIMEIVHK